jgi:hypothetical protein
MTSARELIDQELVANLPEGYVVHPYALQLDGVQGPTLLLRLDTITRLPEAGRHVRDYAAKVLAVAPVADVDLATSQEVDALAEDVLHAIDQSNVLSWSVAERVSVDDTWAGWEVQITTGPLTTTTS